MQAIIVIVTNFALHHDDQRYPNIVVPITILAINVLPNFDFHILFSSIPFFYVITISRHTSLNIIIYQYYYMILDGQYTSLEVLINKTLDLFLI